jgi:hypothetical protein
MARLVFGMMQSLDGYIDGPAGDLKLGPTWSDPLSPFHRLRPWLGRLSLRQTLV